MASAKEVMNYLSGLPRGQQIVSDRLGLVIEANLLVSDGNHERKEENLRALHETAQNEKTPEPLRSRTRELIQMLQHVDKPMRGAPKLSHIASKVDLAAGIKE